MANEPQTSEDETNFLIICKHCSTGKCNQNHKTYLVKSKDFLKIWNNFLLKNFISEEIETPRIGGFRSSNSSDKSVPVREFELLKSIPQNMRQSSFFKELNKKMETFISENQKTETNNKDKLLVSYSNDGSTDEEDILPIETITYSNETINNKVNCSKFKNNEISYTASGTSLNADSDRNSIYIKRAISFTENTTATNNECYFKGFGEYLTEIEINPQDATSFLSEVSKKDHRLLQQRLVGCNMDNAVLFETSETVRQDGTLNDHIMDRNEIYETLSNDRLPGGNDTKLCNQKRINSQSLNRSEKSRLNVLPKVSTNQTIQIISNNSDYKSKINQSAKKLSESSKFSPKLKNCRLTKSVSCLLTDFNCRTVLFTASSTSLPSLKLRENLSILENKDFSSTEKTENNKLGVTLKKSKQNIMQHLKKLSILSGYNNDKSNIIENQIENDKKENSDDCSQFQEKTDSYTQVNTDQWCFCTNESLYYTPSENSFPPCVQKEEEDEEQFKKKTNYSKYRQDVAKNESVPSKVQVDNRKQLKSTPRSNHDFKLTSLDSKCVNVPLDLKKCGWNLKNISKHPIKVIKGIPVFPVNKDFRSFAHFGNKYHLKEEIFEDFVRPVAEDRKEMKRSKIAKDKIYNRSRHNLGPLNKSRDIIEIQNDNGHFNSNTLSCGSFFSHVSGNEIILESIVDVESHGEEIFAKKFLKRKSSEKLHETLLNNIYKSVSIKVKRTNADLKMEQFNGNNLLENITNSKNSDGFEVMLKFAVESMEEEYIRKKLVMTEINAEKLSTTNNGRRNSKSNSEPTIKRTNSLLQTVEKKLKSDDILFKSSCVEMENNSLSKVKLSCTDQCENSKFSSLNNINKCENSEEVVKLSVNRVDEEKNNVIIENTLNTINNSKDKTNIEENGKIISENENITWKDDHDSIRIYPTSVVQNSHVNIISANTSNVEIGSLQIYHDANYHHHDHHNCVVVKRKNVSVEERHPLLERKIHKKQIAKVQKKLSSYNVKTNNEKVLPKCNNGQRNDSGVNVRMLGGKFIIFNPPIANNFEIPRKKTFWGAMLKQTAKLMPFFTFNGAKINLDTLEETLNR